MFFPGNPFPLIYIISRRLGSPAYYRCYCVFLYCCVLRFFLCVSGCIFTFFTHQNTYNLFLCFIGNTTFLVISACTRFCRVLFLCGWTSCNIDFSRSIYQQMNVICEPPEKITRTFSPISINSPGLNVSFNIQTSLFFRRKKCDCPMQEPEVFTSLFLSLCQFVSFRNKLLCE